MRVMCMFCGHVGCGQAVKCQSKLDSSRLTPTQRGKQDVHALHMYVDTPALAGSSSCSYKWRQVASANTCVRFGVSSVCRVCGVEAAAQGGGSAECVRYVRQADQPQKLCAEHGPIRAKTMDHSLNCKPYKLLAKCEIQLGLPSTGAPHATVAAAPAAASRTF